MSDSISELTSQIQTFVDARDWRQFHNAKDLAVAIAAEAGELMQHFVWQQDDQIERRLEKNREEIASEIADVAILEELEGDFTFHDNEGQTLAATRRLRPVTTFPRKKLPWNSAGQSGSSQNVSPAMAVDP